MSGGLNRSFISNPKSFMRGHIIEMSWGNLPAKDNAQVFLEDFDLVANGVGAGGTPRCRLESYTTSHLGLAKAHGPDSHPIRAYWLPYQANSHCETTLGNQAEFMFTATLTGCTLAVGSGMSPKVSHINYQLGGNIDAARVQQKYLKHYRFNVGARAINQNDYFINGVGAQAHTVVGICRENGWKFYLNSRQGNGLGTALLQGSVKIHQNF